MAAHTSPTGPPTVKAPEAEETSPPGLSLGARAVIVTAPPMDVRC